MDKPKANATEARTNRPILDDERQKEVHDESGEFGPPYRFPRTIDDVLAKWVRKQWPPCVFMRETEDFVDVVIRFDGVPENLKPGIRDLFRQSRTHLGEVFDEVLLQAPRKGDDTLKSQLANVGFTAFHQTWKHVLWQLYGESYYHPHGREEFFQKLQRWNAFPEHKRGRIARGREERQQLLARYEKLLGQCEGLHKMVCEATALVGREKGIRPSDIPDKVRMAKWPDVTHLHWGLAILGGEAFAEIPYGKREVHPKWENPDTWRPKHLAIALLAFERGQKYETVERKLRLSKKRSNFV
jgi:hypothetical protein